MGQPIRMLLVRKAARAPLALSFLAVAILSAPEVTNAQYAAGSTEQAAKKHQNVTRIIVNGRSASVGLLDSAGTNGFLTVTQDQVANTVGLDFSYAMPDGFGSIHERTKRVETLGPVTTKVNAEYTTMTATVNGTWGGRSAPDLSGELTDSGTKTYIREITVAC